MGGGSFPFQRRCTTRCVMDFICAACWRSCSASSTRTFFNFGAGGHGGSPRFPSGAEGSTSPYLPRRPMGESFWGERRVRRWGDDNAPQGGPGAQPRHAFGDFRRETKVTRGAGRSARSWGVQRGAAPRIGQQRPRGGAPASVGAGAASSAELSGEAERKKGECRAPTPLPPLALRRAVWYSF